MNKLPDKTINNISQFFTPTELMNIFRDMLSDQNTNKKVIWMKGIYLTNPNNKYYNYDTLRDEFTGEEITIFVSNELKEKVVNGNLVMVAGVVNREVRKGGNIQILLRVTRIEIIQEQTISETDIKLAELRNYKVRIGFKNVDALLENKLYTEERPQIGLLFADSSITHSDFTIGKAAASSHIDFFEHRVSFANVSQFSSILLQLDTKKYDSIAIIRGGGSGLDVFDNINIIETIVNMKTSIICAIGHEEDKMFIKNVSDKVVAVPHALGTYFKDMVERVISEKNKSRAALVENVRKQFFEQLKQQEEQNKTLQKQLKEITESHKISSEKSSNQISNLQKQLKEIIESNNLKDKKSQEQIKLFTDQIKKLTEDRINQDKITAKRTEDLTKQLNASQNKIDMLIKSIQDKDNQINELLNKKRGCFGIAAAIFLFVICLIVF